MRNAAVLAAVLSLAACGKAQKATASGAGTDAAAATKTVQGNAMTGREKVERWATGRNLGVREIRELQVPGMELWAAENEIEFYGLGTVADKPEPLAKQAALRAARERGVKDPGALAGLAMLFLARGGHPVTDAEAQRLQPAQRAMVKPPAVSGDVLEWWHLDGRGAQLERSRLKLDALELETKNAQVITNESADPIELAKQWLAGTNSSLNNAAIDKLVEACKDPRAATMLNEVVTSHKSADARAWAAFQAANCKNGQTVAALITAVEGDSAAPVRKNAADTLGKLGDASAKGALKKATVDPDLNVRGAAERALKKLP